MAIETSRPAARLGVLLAREAPVGVIFRRGPSRRVQVIRWNTDSDLFEPGQWFHGRIYHKRADLSPDGHYMIYFAAKHKPHMYSWTAISRPPYLTALALWYKGDCWDGGGLFEGPTQVWLNHPKKQARLDPETSLPMGLKIRAQRGGGEDWPIWFRRLELGGWQQLTMGEFGYNPPRVRATPVVGYRTKEPVTWARGRPNAAALAPDAQSETAIRLQMKISMRGFKQLLDFELATNQDRRVVLDAEWADWDLSGRLVFARGGRISTAELQEDGTLLERQLADFNANEFEEVPAPDWARTW